MRSESEQFEALLRTVGERLQGRRLEQGISQNKLAKKTRISRSYIIDIEKGRRNPTLDILWILSRHLDVELTYFFGPGAESS